MKTIIPAEGRRHRELHSTLAAFAAAALVSVVFPAPAAAAEGGYTFTKVLDSAHGYDAAMFGCAAINERGDIVTRTGLAKSPRNEADTTELIVRANAAGGVRIMVNEDLAGFRSLGRNPKINDSGQISFWAQGQAAGSGEVIASTNGVSVNVIARTSPDGNHSGEYRFFGVDTTINNQGTVAFRGEPDNGDLGMWSGAGGTPTTHYLDSEGLFRGSFSGVSINDGGQIAFEETAGSQNGIFRGAAGLFTTIASEPGHSFTAPSVNEAGTVAFGDTAFDSNGQVFSILTGSGGELTTIADSTGPFSGFPFRGPAINNDGDVAFKAELDSDFFPGPSGIFTGPDPVGDRVIGTGDSLGARPVSDIVFCENGLNTAGQLAFTAFFEDPVTFERQVVVYRATPVAR